MAITNLISTLKIYKKSNKASKVTVTVVQEQLLPIWLQFARFHEHDRSVSLDGHVCIFDIVNKAFSCVIGLIFISTWVWCRFHLVPIQGVTGRRRSWLFMRYTIRVNCFVRLICLTCCLGSFLIILLFCLCW